MELDKGARFSLILERLRKVKWPEVQLQHTDVRQVAYGGTSVQLIGKANVIVSCNKHAISANVFLFLKREGILYLAVIFCHVFA